MNAAPILLVEDDIDLRDVIAEILKDLGYQVYVAGSGNEAKQVVHAHSDVGLILSDYNMPNGNGKELLEFVRSRDRQRPPFIIITGQAATSAEELVRLGAQECVYKPFDVSRLIELVRKYL